MNKIYLFLSIIGMLVNKIDAQQTYYKAPTGTQTTTARAPNGSPGHTALNGCFLVTASELTGIATVTAINGFGFNLTRGTASTAVTGSIQVYFENTSDATYQKGTNWTSAIAPMTSVYNSTMIIPISNVPTVINMLLPSNFNYTGGGIYVAYQWVSAGPFETGPNVAGYQSEINMNPGGASSASLSAPAPLTLGITNFRPNFNFGFINTWTNEASVEEVVSHGKIPLTMHSPYSFSVVVKNNASVAMSNVTVNLNMSGSNTFSTTTTIPLINVGASLTAVFPAFTPTAYGSSNVTVALLPDDNSFNNTGITTQSVTCDQLAYGQPVSPTVTYSLGVGFQTGSGSILTRIRPTIPSTIVAVDIAISSDGSNINKPVCAMITSSTGALIAKSNTVTLTSAHLNNFNTFFFATPINLNANTNYHIGLVQLTFPHFPIGSTPTSYIPPLSYFQSGVNGGFLSSLTQNLGIFGIEPIYQGDMYLTVNSETICSGNTTTLTASGASTYSWTTGANTNSIIAAPNTTTMYVVTGYSATCSAKKPANVLVNITPTITVPNGGICPSPGSFTLMPVGSTNYTYSGGSDIVSPTVTTIYTVVATSTAGCISNVATPTVYVQNSATVSILGPSSICIGKSAVLTASGAVNYTWSTTSNSPSIVVSPTVANTYGLLGALGTCTSYVTTLITINQNPTISVVASGTTYCIGGPAVNLTASGASSYTWNTGSNSSSIAAIPTVVTTYSVGGSDVNGCIGDKLILIAINPSPTINAVTSSATICVNETATLTATGANNYIWSNNTSTTSAAIITPSATTVYTVTGYALSGCSDTYTIQQLVDPCTGINEILANRLNTKIYPNPNNGTFNVVTSVLSENTHIEVYNSLGQLVLAKKLDTMFTVVNINDLSQGVYILKVKEANELLESFRIIKN